jgi:hypothetical protein
MYVWMWRKLPGDWRGKTAGVFALLLASLALLFFVIFPWLEPRLPFNNVTVSPGATTGPTEPLPSGPAVTPSSSGTPSPSPSALPGD